VALKQAASPEFKSYQQQVLRNCQARSTRRSRCVRQPRRSLTHPALSQAMAKSLTARGYNLVTGGTDNHLVLVDLRPKGVDGSRVERVLELAHIAANKNTVPVRARRHAQPAANARLTRWLHVARAQGDVSALVPGGLRMGTPALTTRGFNERDFEKVAEFVDRAVQIAVAVKAKSGGKLKDFRAFVDTQEIPELVALKREVEDYAKQFPTIGFEKSTMRYKD
jgi:glycine hydroxymethyltransferase